MPRAAAPRLVQIGHPLRRCVKVGFEEQGFHCMATSSKRGRDRPESDKLRNSDDWNAIDIIALSQSNPLKAVAEFVASTCGRAANFAAGHSFWTGAGQPIDRACRGSSSTARPF